MITTLGTRFPTTHTGPSATKIVLFLCMLLSLEVGAAYMAGFIPVQSIASAIHGAASAENTLVSSEPAYLQ